MGERRAVPGERRGERGSEDAGSALEAERRGLGSAPASPVYTTLLHYG